MTFRIARCITRIDAVNALAYVVAQTQWEIANETMQILGGIGYTRVFPVERAVRETRLLQTWTGANDIQNLIIQHEFYKELLSRTVDERNIEADIHLSSEEAAEEKVYE